MQLGGNIKYSKKTEGKEDWKALLRNAVSEIEIDLNENEQGLFGIYLRELTEWNKKINITSIRNTEDIVIKHFLDSLTVLNYVPLSGRVVDIGSGGGFPGIPLKIREPSLNVMLVESNRKKANFLKHIIRSLNLQAIEVYNGRAEDLDRKNFFDYAVSRAFSDLKSFCNLATPLLKIGGHMVSMKGKSVEREIKEKELYDIGAKFISKNSFSLPYDKGRRTIVVLQKCFT